MRGKRGQREVFVQVGRGECQGRLHSSERGGHTRSKVVDRRARSIPPHQAAGTIISIPAIQFRNGAWSGKEVMAQTVKRHLERAHDQGVPHL